MYIYRACIQNTYYYKSINKQPSLLLKGNETRLQNDLYENIQSLKVETTHQQKNLLTRILVYSYKEMYSCYMQQYG